MHQSTRLAEEAQGQHSPQAVAPGAVEGGEQVRSLFSAPRAPQRHPQVLQLQRDTHPHNALQSVSAAMHTLSQVSNRLTPQALHHVTLTERAGTQRAGVRRLMRGPKVRCSAAHLRRGEKDEVEGLNKGGCEGEVALVLQDAGQHAEHGAPAQPHDQLAHDQAAPPLQQPRAARSPEPARAPLHIRTPKKLVSTVYATSPISQHCLVHCFPPNATPVSRHDDDETS